MPKGKSAGSKAKAPDAGTKSALMRKSKEACAPGPGFCSLSGKQRKTIEGSSGVT